MQESLFNTVQKLQTEQKVNVEELEVLLDSDIEEVVSLCKKACLKPKTDDMGNAYFTKKDVDILKKFKELYSQAQDIQNKEQVSKSVIEEANNDSNLNLNKKINFLQKAKSRIKNDTTFALSSNHPMFQISEKLNTMEHNLINKMSEILSEKMDGFDEIIVELIRSKTENENLRQQVNTLNKQVFILKGELASFKPVALGFYVKQEKNDL